MATLLPALLREDVELARALAESVVAAAVRERASPKALGNLGAAAVRAAAEVARRFAPRASAPDSQDDEGAMGAETATRPALRAAQLGAAAAQRLLAAQYLLADSGGPCRGGKEAYERARQLAPASAPGVRQIKRARDSALHPTQRDVAPSARAGARDAQLEALAADLLGTAADGEELDAGSAVKNQLDQDLVDKLQDNTQGPEYIICLKNDIKTIADDLTSQLKGHHASLKTRFDELETTLHTEVTREASSREANISELRGLIGGYTLTQAEHHSSLLELSASEHAARDKLEAVHDELRDGLRAFRDHQEKEHVARATVEASVEERFEQLLIVSARHGDLHDHYASLKVQLDLEAVPQLPHAAEGPLGTERGLPPEPHCDLTHDEWLAYGVAEMAALAQQRSDMERRLQEQLGLASNYEDALKSDD